MSGKLVRVKHKVYVGLGANLGDREATIRRAVELLAATPGIETDSLLRDPGRNREGEALLEERSHIGDDVVVARVVLHRARLAEHVHEAEIGIAVGDDTRHVRVGAERRDVVDHRCPERERSSGDLGLRRVDRDRSACQRREDRLDPPQLLGRRDAVGTGARRLSADIDESRALGEQPARLGNGDVGGEKAPAVRERVGRHVDDPEHGRPR